MCEICLEAEAKCCNVLLHNNLVELRGENNSIPSGC